MLVGGVLGLVLGADLSDMENFGSGGLSTGNRHPCLRRDITDPPTRDKVVIPQPCVYLALYWAGVLVAYFDSNLKSWTDPKAVTDAQPDCI